MALVRRKECWALTIGGWLCLGGALCTALFGVGLGVHPFLAITEPVQSEILVVEGWLPDDALERVMGIFRSGTYRSIVAVGGPLEYGSYLVGYGSCSEVAADTLEKLGFPESLIQVISAPRVHKDNTYAGALALNKWLEGSRPPIHSLDICSLGPHARRTRLLFEKALGRGVKVGIIALQSEEYDPEAWWKTSKGVRTVISEAVAYLYARFFFYP